MITIKHITIYEDRITLLKVMNNYESFNNSYIYGFFKDNICIGGASVSDKDKSSFTLVLNIPPSIEIGKLMAELFKIILPIFGQITAKIYRNNTKSIKMATQMGFRKIISEQEYNIYIFSKELWRYENKWPITK